MTRQATTVILGGGLAGLSAACMLTRAGRAAVVLESGPAVGGLARTIEHDGFRFDLGGHRFLTKDRSLERLISDLLGDDLLDVPRSSKILLRGRLYDYPLKPANALFGLGPGTTLRVLLDYAREQFAAAFRTGTMASLEDWVVRHFGRALFELYFRDYSEKVWGIPGNRVSAEWVAQRIAGLSLWKAVKNAVSRRSGRDIGTLADRFLYPRLGIGQISDRLRSGIEAGGEVRTGTAVLRLRHDRGSITGIMVRSGRDVSDISADEFISSIPVTHLVRMLHPLPPEDVRAAASGLRYRDLVVVAVMLDQPRVTDLTWLYLPDRDIPFGRIHEPTNWSPFMAPDGKTLLVAEYFCFSGDRVWNASDRALTDLTVRHLALLGLIAPSRVIGSCVVRVPRAYPLMDVDYRRRHDRIMEYLGRFRNLRVIGRSGTFQYLNMDHAIASGIRAAEDLLNNRAGEAKRGTSGRGASRVSRDPRRRGLHRMGNAAVPARQCASAAAETISS